VWTCRERLAYRRPSFHMVHESSPPPLFSSRLRKRLAPAAKLSSFLFNSTSRCLSQYLEQNPWSQSISISPGSAPEEASLRLEVGRGKPAREISQVGP